LEPEIPPSVFDFLGALVSGELVSEPRSGFSRHSVLRLAMKLQQYSGPVMAKGLEDTAFYRYNRFVALNEVGGEPDQFGLALPAFHKANVQRAKFFPAAMLGTSTHDTKRGEDTRARLAVLSSMPDEWSRQVQSWSRLVRARRGDVEGTAPPDRNDEYLLYQLLIGSWPVELLDPAALETEAGKEGLTAYAKRIAGALEKSMREAKLHSNWSAPNAAYEEAMQRFAADALDPTRPAFLTAFLPFAQRVAKLSVETSLAQLVLKLTLPGMPDIYQGCELWDLSLMDPDNRRAVDYASRQQLLERVETGLSGDRITFLERAFEFWEDGLIKLALTRILLELRAAYPVLFAGGTYEAIAVEDERVVAFRRDCGDASLIVAVSRFPAAAGERMLTLPLPSGEWRDALRGGVSATVTFETLPVSVMVKA
jgi:(1->4)-alpha-D-glucan 1-alpha-D-glucosylmutase